MIQIVITALLSGQILYLLLRQSRFVTLKYFLIAVLGAGLYFTWYPDMLTRFANDLGVGRGVDLVFYLWIIFSFMLFILQSMRARSVDARLTHLTRAIALLNAKKP